MFLYHFRERGVIPRAGCHRHTAIAELIQQRAAMDGPHKQYEAPHVRERTSNQITELNVLFHDLTNMVGTATSDWPHRSSSSGSRRWSNGELPSPPAIRIGQDGVPPLATGRRLIEQSREHGVNGLPEDLHVCAAASAARLAAPASPRRARYVDN